MTWVRIAEQADGDVWTVQLWRKIQDDLNEGVMRPLATTTVGGGGAASIDISSISGDYETLILLGTFRGDTAATAANLLIRLNNDSGASYDFERTYSFATTIGNDETYASTSINVLAMPAATAVANSFAPAVWVFPGYASASIRKAVLIENGYKMANSSGNFVGGRICGFWRNTAAVTRITIFPGAGNLAQYSSATLYGVT